MTRSEELQARIDCARKRAAERQDHDPDLVERLLRAAHDAETKRIVKFSKLSSEELRAWANGTVPDDVGSMEIDDVEGWMTWMFGPEEDVQTITATAAATLAGPAVRGEGGE